MASSAFSVEIAPAAEEDLETAVEYYLRVAGKASASRFLDRYEQVIDHLESVPAASAAIGDTGYLWIPVGSFVLVYSIDEGSSVVKVVRMHYATWNWKELALSKSID